MRYLVAACILFGLAQPCFADDLVESRTVNGHRVDLVQVGQGDYRVRVDGKDVLGSGLPQAEWAFEGVHSGNGKSYVVLTRTGGGGCAAYYYAIDLSGHVPVVSKQMGNCSNETSISVINGALEVIFWKDGVLQMLDFDGQTTGPLVTVPQDATDKCNNATVKDLAAKAIANLLEHGQTDALRQEIKLLGGHADWVLEKLYYAIPVKDDPSDEGGKDVTPLGTKPQNDGFQYDGGAKTGQIVPAAEQVCASAVGLKVTYQNMTMRQANVIEVNEPLQFMVQPVPGGTYNIAIFGLLQAVTATQLLAAR